MIKSKLKYTYKQEQEMIALYTGVPEDDLSEKAFAERSLIIEELADKYHKNTKMIIAKLAKMKIYITKPKVSKVTGKKAETKEAMVRRLEAKKGWPLGDFNGLEKSPKIVIQKLLGEFES